MSRLFAAISIPLEIKKQINLIKNNLSGARWTIENDYHITLSFIGDMDDIRTQVIEKILSEIRLDDFNIKLGRLGCFCRNKKTKYLYAKVEDNEELVSLKNKIDRDLESYNISIDKTEYKPHVTIAIVTDSNESEVLEFIKAHDKFSTDNFRTCGFSLYKSHENNGAGFYTNYKEYPLMKILKTS